VRVALDASLGIKNFRNEIIWAYNSGGASRRRFAQKHDSLLWYAKRDDYVFNVQREPYATPNAAQCPGFHPEGRMLTDVWPMSFISTTSRERVGYPTQKPLALARRVIAALSDPGDWVGDIFAGSGTVGVAAQQMGRHAFLVDANPDAIDVIRGRMSNA
jgi:site-specific DNA-methyltransferase (adenine-specific)